MKVLFFTSPYCGPCNAIKQTVKDAIMSAGAIYEEIDVSTPAGKGRGDFYNVVVTPELITVDNSGRALTHLVGSADITTKLDTALKNNEGGLSNGAMIAIGAAIVLTGILIFKKRKKRIGRVGRIVASDNKAGKTLCRDYKRSTSTNPGRCSYHNGVDKR